MTLDDNEDEVYALAAFYDYPNVHGVPSNDWEDKWWKKNSFDKTADTSKVNAINTLFLHLFVAHPDFSEGCAEEILNVTFRALPEVNQILLCLPPQVTPGLFSVENNLAENIRNFDHLCRGCVGEIFQAYSNRTSGSDLCCSGLLSKRSFSSIVYSNSAVKMNERCIYKN